MYKTLNIGDEKYPKKLMEMNNPPKTLYYVGDENLLQNKIVAIVGSRKSSPYGQWASKMISTHLARKGVTVISGMAKGIDTFAHLASVDETGSTIAVLGCGIDQCYPAFNWKLKERIGKRGLVISEYEEGVTAKRWTFPQRNRIIAGLCDMVVVIEAGLNSGAIITAEYASEIGREVMCLPGNINSVFSMGSNKLILDGATPIVAITDVLDRVGISKDEIVTKSLQDISDEEKRVYDIIKDIGHTNSNYIAKIMNMNVKDVNVIITVLEIKGLVANNIGQVYLI